MGGEGRGEGGGGGRMLALPAQLSSLNYPFSSRQSTNPLATTEAITCIMEEEEAPDSTVKVLVSNHTNTISLSVYDTALINTVADGGTHSTEALHEALAM